MNILPHILFCIVALMPYLTLLYKKVNIRIRLLFSSLFEIIIFYVTMFLIIKYIDNPIFVLDGYFVEIIFACLLFFNFFAILSSWFFKKDN